MDERKIVNRVFTLPCGAAPMTVDAVLDWCHERGLEPTQVIVSGGHLRYESPQTDEEKARTDAFEAERVRRMDEWERATFERLSAKFAAE